MYITINLTSLNIASAGMTGINEHALQERVRLERERERERERELLFERETEHLCLRSVSAWRDRR